MARPRPLDKFVWVQHTGGKQRRVLRSQLPSLSPNWERIPDPTKKTADAEPAGDAPVSKKRIPPAKPDSEKE